MLYTLSKHAALRVQQRGVPHHLVAALMNHADFEAPVGGGCTVLRMTRERLSDPEPPARAAASAVRALRVARGPLLLTTGTALAVLDQPTEDSHHHQHPTALQAPAPHRSRSIGTGGRDPSECAARKSESLTNELFNLNLSGKKF